MKDRLEDEGEQKSAEFEYSHQVGRGKCVSTVKSAAQFGEILSGTGYSASFAENRLKGRQEDEEELAGKGDEGEAVSLSSAASTMVKPCHLFSLNRQRFGPFAPPSKFYLCLSLFPPSLSRPSSLVPIMHPFFPFIPLPLSVLFSLPVSLLPPSLCPSLCLSTFSLPPSPIKYFTACRLTLLTVYS